MKITPALNDLGENFPTIPKDLPVFLSVLLPTMGLSRMSKMLPVLDLCIVWAILENKGLA